MEHIRADFPELRCAEHKVDLFSVEEELVNWNCFE